MNSSVQMYQKYQKHLSEMFNAIKMLLKQFRSSGLKNCQSKEEIEKAKWVSSPGEDDHGEQIAKDSSSTENHRDDRVHSSKLKQRCSGEVGQSQQNNLTF